MRLSKKYGAVKIAINKVKIYYLQHNVLKRMVTSVDEPLQTVLSIQFGRVSDALEEMDLYSRKIIAWTLSDTLEAVHVADTVRKAMKSRKITEPLVLHSDRGSQYVSKAYLEATSKLQLSYSKKGYPYDNACIEAFHSLIKREWLNRFRIKDWAHAHKLVF